MKKIFKIVILGFIIFIPFNVFSDGEYDRLGNFEENIFENGNEEQLKEAILEYSAMMNEEDEDTFLLEFVKKYPFYTLCIYIFFSYCQYIISKKYLIKNSWFAFIPILNTLNFVEIGGRNKFEGILLFIPFLNIIEYILVCYGLSVRRGGGHVFDIIITFFFFPIILILEAFSD